jgi:hypothetical protein
VKRIKTFTTILLLLTSLALNTTFAQQKRSKSLNQAVVDGDIDLVKSQISEGADLNSKNRMGWTLLQTAIRNKRMDIAQLLIDKGADVNAKDNRGRTPLHFAVESGQKAIVETLIAKGADVNVMDGRFDNALSLAKKNGQAEITQLLIKHGAQEPNPEELGNRLYYSQARPQGANSYPDSASRNQPRSRSMTTGQSSVAADLLADPNEIKTRVKTFDGLEKSVKMVSDKSKNEERQWLQTRYDNRTALLRAVDKQIEDEIDFVRKVAVEESAQKTTEAIDSLRTNRRRRSLKVNRELMQQKREQKLTEYASTRGRGRTTGRSTRGRTSMRGQTSGTNTTNPVYGSGAVTTPRGYGTESTGRPAEQLDPQTEEQMRLWMQTTTDKKLELARAIHPQIQAEIGYIRTIAVEEKAKKTTAAIDGLLLARKERFDKLVIKMEEDQRKLQAAQGMQNRTNDPGQAYQQGGRYGGRMSRRGTGAQTGNPQQQNTRRTRRR